MPEPTDKLSEDRYVISETKHQRMLRVGRATPIFLQGAFPFLGHGAVTLSPINEALKYRVPQGKTAEAIYFRAGNFTSDLLYLALCADGKPIRYFPIGPKGDVHVPLAIIEAHSAGTLFEVWLAAPRELTGTVVIDVGILEIEEN